MKKCCQIMLKIIVIFAAFVLMVSCGGCDYSEDIESLYNIDNSYGYDIVYREKAFFSYTIDYYYFIDYENDFTTCITCEYKSKGRTGRGELTSIKFLNFYNNTKPIHNQFSAHILDKGKACREFDEYLLKARKEWWHRFPEKRYK